MSYGVLLLAIVLGIFLWGMSRRAKKVIIESRKGIFDECIEIFSDATITQDSVNYPVLKAQHQGLNITIEPMIDHMAVRKIPALWLMVTIESPVKYSGVLDYLVRPHNHEFYSPSTHLDTRIDIPTNWPQHQALLKTDNINDIPPLDVIGRYVAREFNDTNSKELLITPKGVRIIYLLDQAARSHYMVLRQIVFENDRLEKELVEHLLSTLHELLNDLSNTHQERSKTSVKND